MTQFQSKVRENKTEKSNLMKIRRSSYFIISRCCVGCTRVGRDTMLLNLLLGSGILSLLTFHWPSKLSDQLTIRYGSKPSNKKTFYGNEQECLIL